MDMVTAGKTAAELARCVAAGDVDLVPVQQVLARGLGRPVHVAPGLVYVDSIGGADGFLWAEDAAEAAALLSRCPRPAMVEVTGRAAAEAVARAFPGSSEPQGHLVCAYLAATQPPVADALEIRPLGPDHADLVIARYSHPEYFSREEIVRRLAAGTIDGGYLDGELVGFIGMHAEGSMGMLEVFPGWRRRGVALALEAAKIASGLAAGHVPWAQVFPENRASIALQHRLGMAFGSGYQAFLDCGGPA